MTKLLEELQTLEAELHHAGKLCSQARLDALLHADFHEVGRSGLRYSREVVMNYLASIKLAPRTISSDYAVHLLSADCALLTYRSIEQTADGAWVNPALRSSIWRREAGQWQLFYHQGTPEKA